MSIQHKSNSSKSSSQKIQKIIQSSAHVSQQIIGSGTNIKIVNQLNASGKNIKKQITQQEILQQTQPNITDTYYPSYLLQSFILFILFGVCIFLWVKMGSQNQEIMNGIILSTTAFVLVVISFLILYGFRHDKNDHKCITNSLILMTLIIVPLLFASSVIFSFNIVKIQQCPNYTFPLIVNASNQNQTICVCNDGQFFQYTTLGKNTFGVQCCDCSGITPSCSGSCSMINKMGNSVAIINIILSISQIFVLLWLIY